MGQWSTRQVLAAGDPVSVTPVNTNFSSIASILNGNIDNTNLKDDAVTTAKILNDAVTADKIATDAVTSDGILAGAVGIAEVADGAITLGKLSATSGYGLYGGFAAESRTNRGLGSGNSYTYTGGSTVSITPSDNVIALAIMSAGFDNATSATNLSSQLFEGSTNFGGFAQRIEADSNYRSCTVLGVRELTADTAYTFTPKFVSGGSVTVSGVYIAYNMVVLLFPR